MLKLKLLLSADRLVWKVNKFLRRWRQVAEAIYKMEQGSRGGYVAYVQVTSPLLKEKSGKWFVVTPENASPLPRGMQYEYANIWMAERAARETALRLAGKVTQMEHAANPPSVVPTPKKQRRGR